MPHANPSPRPQQASPSPKPQASPLPTPKASPSPSPRQSSPSPQPQATSSPSPQPIPSPSPEPSNPPESCNPAANLWTPEYQPWGDITGAPQAPCRFPFSATFEDGDGSFNPVTTTLAGWSGTGTSCQAGFVGLGRSLGEGTRAEFLQPNNDCYAWVQRAGSVLQNDSIYEQLVPVGSGEDSRKFVCRAQFDVGIMLAGMAEYTEQINSVFGDINQCTIAANGEEFAFFGTSFELLTWTCGKPCPPPPPPPRPSPSPSPEPSPEASPEPTPPPTPVSCFPPVKGAVACCTYSVIYLFPYSFSK